jgi:thioredoxin 1
MATVNITEDSFRSTIKLPGLVLIDWWAPWCGPCRMFGPIFERVSQKHPEATFGKVDTEAEPALAQAFEISSIPTLMVIRDGVLLLKQPGMLPEAALEGLIEQAMKLDMEQVRKDGPQRRESVGASA